jgi:hypothetical protein
VDASAPVCMCAQQSMYVCNLLTSLTAAGRAETVGGSAGHHRGQRRQQRCEEGGHVLHELRHDDDDHLEAEHEGRDGLQRLRPVLQAPRGESADDDAPGHDTHASA